MTEFNFDVTTLGNLVEELAETWVNGNRKDVLGALHVAPNPAKLTALIFLEMKRFWTDKNADDFLKWLTRV